MLKAKEEKYDLSLCMKNRKTGEESFYSISNLSLCTAVYIILIIAPLTITFAFIAWADSATALITLVPIAISVYCLLVMISCSFVRSCILYAMRYSRCIPTHADNPLENENVLEELICHDATRYDTRSSEKSVQTDMTIQKFVTESITIENIRDYDIPNSLRSASELTTVDYLFQRKIDNLDSIMLENGKPKEPKSIVSTDTGITGFTSLSSEDLLERIGPSTSKSMALENTVLEDHNINVSADVVVYSPFNSCKNSFDTDSLESQITK